ncbi:hypothetical protein CHS0354_024284 [Potamilus streckersoni]|uniref:Uncharacterized protein n=1 Tax=Potamilus streckersoni TaxID=2493646 RepID=A0AAE0RLD9_9BIVA|nr:hypothetical protein CHS0354_024284 [Potamilus streckersoni]
MHSSDERNIESIQCCYVCCFLWVSAERGRVVVVNDVFFSSRLVSYMTLTHTVTFSILNYFTAPISFLATSLEATRNKDKIDTPNEQLRAGLICLSLHIGVKIKMQNAYGRGNPGTSAPVAAYFIMLIVDSD